MADDAITETVRLILRRFRDADLADWLQHLNTAQVRAHFGGVASEAESTEKFVRQRDSWSDAAGGWLAVERKEDGAFLGYVGFGDITADAAPAALQGSPEIGWTLRADAWGQGYATEAARALMGLIFERYDRPVVYSQTSEANRASWRVMERLGMERMEQLDYVDPLYPPEENPTKIYGLARG